MKLSLSGRLVESGSETLMPVQDFLQLAARTGYDAVDLRRTQLSPTNTVDEVGAIRAGLADTGLAVFETAYAGSLDGAGAAEFAAFAKRVAGLGGEAIRMGGDLATLKRAAQLSAPHGVRVVYQMHTNGSFETVAMAAQSLAEIDEPNFGIMPEPSNLLMAGEAFEEDMFAPLAGRIFGVHVQTLEVSPDAENALKLCDGTEVRYQRVPYAENHQIDFAMFFAALRNVGFDGFVNELEPCQPLDQLEDTVTAASTFLRPFLV